MVVRHYGHEAWDVMAEAASSGAAIFLSGSGQRYSTTDSGQAVRLWQVLILRGLVLLARGMGIALMKRLEVSPCQPSFKTFDLRYGSCGRALASRYWR